MGWRGGYEENTSGRNKIAEGVFLCISLGIPLFFSVFVVFQCFRNIFCWRCSHPAVSITAIRLPWILQLERWSRGAIDPVLHQIDQLLVKTSKQPRPWDGWHNEKWPSFRDKTWNKSMRPNKSMGPKGLVWSDFTGLDIIWNTHNGLYKRTVLTFTWNYFHHLFASECSEIATDPTESLGFLPFKASPQIFKHLKPTNQRRKCDFHWGSICIWHQHMEYHNILHRYMCQISSTCSKRNWIFEWRWKPLVMQCGKIFQNHAVDGWHLQHLLSQFVQELNHRQSRFDQTNPGPCTEIYREVFGLTWRRTFLTHHVHGENGKEPKDHLDQGTLW